MLSPTPLHPSVPAAPNTCHSTGWTKLWCLVWMANSIVCFLLGVFGTQSLYQAEEEPPSWVARWNPFRAASLLQETETNGWLRMYAPDFTINAGTLWRGAFCTVGSGICSLAVLQFPALKAPLFILSKFLPPAYKPSPLAWDGSPMHPAITPPHFTTIQPIPLQHPYHALPMVPALPSFHPSQTMPMSPHTPPTISPQYSSPPQLIPAHLTPQYHQPVPQTLSVHPACSPHLQLAPQFQPWSATSAYSSHQPMLANA